MFHLLARSFGCDIVIGAGTNVKQYADCVRKCAYKYA